MSHHGCYVAVVAKDNDSLNNSSMAGLNHIQLANNASTHMLNNKVTALLDNQRKFRVGLENIQQQSAKLLQNYVQTPSTIPYMVYAVPNFSPPA